jgi:D-3-phosphoglycerate dehydrogenase
MEFVSFDELLRRSDFVSIHSPLVPETLRLFDKGTLQKMKPTAYLINTARGAIIDDAALADALDRCTIAGAALDVLPDEPPGNSPLLGRANVILTPHMSFYSVEALVELQKRAAQEVVRVMRGEKPLHPVNPEALTHQEIDKP